MVEELWTERLHLRVWRESDAEAYRLLWTERDPRSLRLIDAVGRPSVDDLRQWLAQEPARRRDEGISLLVITRRIEGDFVGYCGLTVGRGSVDEPEIAYELAGWSHGHGYATEAARAVVTAARETGRRRLWAGVRVWNTASLRVLDKLSFHDSGRLTPDAERGDTVWMTRWL